MMKDRVVEHGTTTSVFGSPDHSRAENQRIKEKRQQKVQKVDQKELEDHSLVKTKHRNQNCGLKKIVLGGLKENEARKALPFFKRK